MQLSVDTAHLLLLQYKNQLPIMSFIKQRIDKLTEDQTDESPCRLITRSVRPSVILCVQEVGTHFL